MCERANTQLHKKLSCSLGQTSDVRSGSSVQLFCASRRCRRPYSQSNQTSFPRVILSLSNQQGWRHLLWPPNTGISVNHSIDRIHALAHIYTENPHPGSPFLPIHAFVNHLWSNRLFCWSGRSGYIYLEQAIPDCRPIPSPVLSPQPPWFCLNPGCNEAVWLQITQNTSRSLGGTDEDFQQDGSWRCFASMSAHCEKCPS